MADAPLTGNSRRCSITSPRRSCGSCSRTAQVVPKFSRVIPSRLRGDVAVRQMQLAPGRRHRARTPAVLLERVGTSQHQACLMLTSREEPPEVCALEGERAPVQKLELSGLSGTRVASSCAINTLRATHWPGRCLSTSIAATAWRSRLWTKLSARFSGATSRPFSSRASRSSAGSADCWTFRSPACPTWSAWY
jgi:hypothetical protein